MDAIIGQAEPDEECVHSENGFDLADDGNASAAANEDGLLAESLLDSAAGGGHGRSFTRNEDRGGKTVLGETDFRAFGAALAKCLLKCGLDFGRMLIGHE